MGATSTEGEMWVVSSGYVELEGVAECIRIPVGRRVPHDNLVARGDRGSRQLCVPASRPAHVQDRCGPPNHLVDRRRHKPRVGDHCLPLVRVVGEGHAPVDDGRPGGLITGENQKLEEVPVLGRRKALTVSLGLHQSGYQVVGWLSKAQSTHLLSVLEESMAGWAVERKKANRRDIAIGIIRQGRAITRPLHLVVGEFH